MDASLALKMCSYVHFKYFYIIHSLGLIKKKSRSIGSEKSISGKFSCLLSSFWLLDPIRSAFKFYLRLSNNEIILIE